MSRISDFYYEHKDPIWLTIILLFGVAMGTLMYYGLRNELCNDVEKTYTVQFIRPDGVLHKTIQVTTYYKPRIGSVCGSLEVFGHKAPVGWMLEVKELAEKTNESN